MGIVEVTRYRVNLCVLSGREQCMMVGRTGKMLGADFPGGQVAEVKEAHGCPVLVVKAELIGGCEPAHKAYLRWAQPTRL